MERLTECDKVGNWGLRGVPWEKLNKGNVITDDIYEKLYGALHKLMEYENTGLTPEKLVEIDEAYTQQAKELAAYKQEKEIKAICLYQGVKEQIFTVKTELERKGIDNMK